MRFAFNERKSAQAAARLIHRHGGAMSYMALIKLLYLADRRCLVEAGAPITGDLMVSMPYGPVLSRIYERITWGAENQASPWFDYISEPEHYAVRALITDTDELSRYELRVLDETHETFGSMDRWALVRYTHTLPEWRDPQGSSLAIDPVEILRAEGISAEEIRLRLGESEAAFVIDQLAKR